MIRWKAQLQSMLHRLAKLLLILFVLSGCSQKSWICENWISEFALKAGFSTNEMKAVKDYLEFGLVELSESVLKEKFNAETARLICEKTVSSCSLPKLMEVLNVSMIKDKDVLSYQQGQDLMNWMIDELNSFDEGQIMNLVTKTEPVLVTVIDRNQDWILIDKSVQIHDVVNINDEFFEVIEISDSWIRIQACDYEDMKEIDVSGSMKLNLEDAQITLHNEIVKMSELKAGLPAFRLSKSFDFHGFQIRFSTSSDALHIYASKKTESGIPLFVQFDINEIKCDFAWKSKDDLVDQARMKVSYETTLTSGFRTARYQDRMLDASKLNTNDLLHSLKQAFVPKKDVIEETLELAEIQLPFPQIPACTLKMKVLLHLHASGKAEIAFESDHVIGFETVNGRLRLIHDSQKESHVSMRASGKASTQLQFLLSVLNQDCMDVSSELGIAGALTTRLNLEDEIVDIDVPYEMAEEMLEESVVCADFDAYWLLNLMFNSKKTLLGSFGLSKTFELLDESNASLFGKTVHLENFQPVNRCTRSLQRSDDLALDVSSDRIELKHYLVVLDEGKSASIVISSLPEGVLFSDVMFISMDETIASVSSKGLIQAHQSGETIIKVSSKDALYEVQCSVIVR